MMHQAESKSYFQIDIMPPSSVKVGQEYKIEGQVAPDSSFGTEFVQGFATTRSLLLKIAFEI